MMKNASQNYNPQREAEIMARYRPIAPRPKIPESSNCEINNTRKSPYLGNIWPQLQARPTRSRKRGFYSVSQSLLKRQRAINGLCSPFATLPAKNLSLQGFAYDPSHQLAMTDQSAANYASEMVSSCTCTSNSKSSMNLPSFSCATTVSPTLVNQEETPESSMIPVLEKSVRNIDLNTTAEVTEEKDFLPQLQGPNRVFAISPRPIRPVGSRITVRCITEQKLFNLPIEVSEEAEKIEQVLELEKFPALITGLNNKVRMVNSTYNEMVGQPECSWLDSFLEKCSVDCTSKCRRVSGEVKLHLSNANIPMSSKGFAGWVSIEWGIQGKESIVATTADVVRVACKSRDYLFIWRFLVHFNKPSPSSSNVNT